MSGPLPKHLKYQLEIYCYQTVGDLFAIMMSPEYANKRMEYDRFLDVAVQAVVGNYLLEMNIQRKHRPRSVEILTEATRRIAHRMLTKAGFPTGGA